MRTKLAAAILLMSLSGRGQEWQQFADFAGTPRDDAAAFSHNCKVYVGTGMEVGWNLTNDWWRYDVIQGSWLQVASLPASPRQYCTAHAIDGIGYLFGGLDASGPLNALWAYDPATDTWSARTPLPGPGRYASASFTTNGKLYIAGGLIAGGSALSELWEYDPATDQWTPRADLPGPGRHRAAAISPLYTLPYPLVIGGADAAYTPLSDVLQYGPGDAWTARAPLPEARYGMMASDSPYALVIGGAVDNSTFRSDGFTYHPWTDTWSPFLLGELPDGRRGGAMGWAECSGIHYSFVGLGLDGNSTRRNDWYGTGYVFSVPEHAQGSLTVAPNPAQDFLTLQGQGSKLLHVRVVDASGAVALRRSDWPSERPLPIGHLAPGAYMIHATTAGTNAAARFIKLP